LFAHTPMATQYARQIIGPLFADSAVRGRILPRDCRKRRFGAFVVSYAAGGEGQSACQIRSPAQLPATVLHLYGLTQSPGPSAELFRGLEGSRWSRLCRTARCAGLICWISRVSEADFARDLARNMQDSMACAATTRHQQVVSAIARAAEHSAGAFRNRILTRSRLGSHIETRKLFEADFNRIRARRMGASGFCAADVPVPKKTIRTGRNTAGEVPR